MPENKTPKDLAYYLTLFKIEGHTTWRAHLCGYKNGFKQQVENDKAKVTESMVIRIDRITGTFSEAK